MTDWIREMASNPLGIGVLNLIKMFCLATVINFGMWCLGIEIFTKNTMMSTLGIFSLLIAADAIFGIFRII